MYIVTGSLTKATVCEYLTIILIMFPKKKKCLYQLAWSVLLVPNLYSEFSVGCFRRSSFLLENFERVMFGPFIASFVRSFVIIISHLQI